jgi:cytochrome c2
VKKVLLTILLLVIVIIAGVAAYVKFGLPHLNDAPDLKVDVSEERIKHGEYLANHVALCMDCHSTRDWSKFSGPLVHGTLGKGGETFDEKMGFPGKFYSYNITPANLNSWSDGEIFRTITTGVDKNGHALFPVMPYSHYGKMDREDIYDIIAYIRSLEPIENQIPERTIAFPMNFIINTIPVEGNPGKKPSPSDTLQYGAYMTNAAGCIECHTQVKRGQIIPELAFGGGREFQMPGGMTRSANITPEKETGIGSWTAETFISRFKAFDKSDLTMGDDKLNTPMPWSMFAGMDSSDLNAIYVYLKSVTPIKNKVEHFVKN